jgi:hypothetical protein
VLDTDRLHLLHEVRPEDPIAIAQQIAWRRLPEEGFAQLLGSPLRGRTSSDAQMQNAPPLAGDAAMSLTLRSEFVNILNRTAVNQITYGQIRSV